jgi:hypothetical protein
MPRQNKRSEQGHRIAVVERGLLESAQSFPPPFLARLPTAPVPSPEESMRKF